MVDRETVMQVGVSAGAVALFVAIAIYASSAYAQPVDNASQAGGHLTATGGYVLVGAVVAFVLVIAAAGFWLSRQDFEDDD